MLPPSGKFGRRPRTDAAAGRVRALLDAAPGIEAHVAEGRPADEWLSARFRAAAKAGARDRRMLADVLFSLFRWRGWTESYSRAGPRALYAAFQLQAREPDDSEAALAAAAGIGEWRLPPLGGAPVRESARVLAGWLGRETLAVERLVPGWVPGALALPEGRPDPGFVRACVESFQVRPPLWLFALGVPAETLAAGLRGLGFPAEADPREPRAVRVEGRPHFPELERRIGPCFEPQDLASQAVTAACDPMPGQAWWDACAGAGGKSLGLAQRMGGAGRVEATEPRERAAREIARRARRAGLPVRVSRRRADRDPAPRPGRFHGVLVDAPCSGLGTWSRSPDARWRTPETVPAELAATQARLLGAAARAVRPGGRLVYSVCTLTRRETLEAAAAFGRAHPEFRPDPFPHPLGQAPASAAAWILPWQGPCGAMFIARWKRK